MCMSESEYVYLLPFPLFSSSLHLLVRLLKAKNPLTDAAGDLKDASHPFFAHPFVKEMLLHWYVWSLTRASLPLQLLTRSLVCIHLCTCVYFLTAFASVPWVIRSRIYKWIEQRFRVLKHILIFLFSSLSHFTPFLSLSLSLSLSSLSLSSFSALKMKTQSNHLDYTLFIAFTAPKTP